MSRRPRETRPSGVDQLHLVRGLDVALFDVAEQRIDRHRRSARPPRGDLRSCLCSRHRASSSRCRAIDLADLRRGGGHDVEVPRVRGEEVACPFHLEEDRDASVLAEDSRRIELRLGAQPVARHVLLHLRRPCRRSTHRPSSSSTSVGKRAEDRVAHDQRRLGGVEDDDRLAALGAADRLDGRRRGARELVDVRSGARARPTSTRRSRRSRRTRRAHSATRRRPSGSWPDRRRSPCSRWVHEMCSARFTGGITYGPRAAGVRSIARMPASR